MSPGPAALPHVRDSCPIVRRALRPLAAGGEALTIAAMGAEVIEFETPRLRLRQWRESDRDPFAAMNTDPSVMEFFPALISCQSSDASIDLWQAQFAERGWSNWAAEVRATGEFIGFVGLSVPRRVLPFSPCVEIGWRLAKAHPGVPEGNPLRPHCLYRLKRVDWKGA